MIWVLIIIMFGSAGAAALAIWLVDERGKMKAAREVNDTLNDINKTLDEVGAPPVPRPLSGYQPRCLGPTPDPSKIELPTGSGAYQPKTVIVMPPEEFQRRANEIMDEIRDKYTLHVHEPTIADATDRKTVERIREFVDDSVRNPRPVEIVEADWRPLPMADLRRKLRG